MICWTGNSMRSFGWRAAAAAAVAAAAAARSHTLSLQLATKQLTANSKLQLVCVQAEHIQQHTSKLKVHSSKQRLQLQSGPALDVSAGLRASRPTKLQGATAHATARPS